MNYFFFYYYSRIQICNSLNEVQRYSMWGVFTWLEGKNTHITLAHFCLVQLDLVPLLLVENTCTWYFFSWTCAFNIEALSWHVWPHDTSDVPTWKHVRFMSALFGCRCDSTPTQHLIYRNFEKGKVLLSRKSVYLEVLSLCCEVFWCIHVPRRKNGRNFWASILGNYQCEWSYFTFVARTLYTTRNFLVRQKKCVQSFISQNKRFTKTVPL